MDSETPKAETSALVKREQQITGYPEAGGHLRMSFGILECSNSK